MSNTKLRVGAVVLGALLASTGAVGTTAAANGMHGHAFAGGMGGHVAFHGGGFAHSRAMSAPRFQPGGNIGRSLVVSRTAVGPHSASHYAGSRYAGLNAHSSFAQSANWNHRDWHGGYWRGAYWPRAYYGAGFPWFLATLPAFYTTLWFDGVPYYYTDDAYYTWNQDQDGYVATEPPPAEAPASDAYGGQIYAYPTQGQSAQQQATDRQECQEWASSQTGGGATTTGNSADDRRATIACLEGRGYSAK